MKFFIHLYRFLGQVQSSLLIDEIAQTFSKRRPFSIFRKEYTFLWLTIYGSQSTNKNYSILLFLYIGFYSSKIVANQRINYISYGQSY